MQVRSLGGDDLLEEGMAIHSSILAWRISQTEKPGRLQVHGVAKELRMTRFKGNCSHSAPSHGKEQSCNWANLCKANPNPEPQGLLTTLSSLKSVHAPQGAGILCPQVCVHPMCT